MADWTRRKILGALAATGLVGCKTTATGPVDGGPTDTVVPGGTSPPTDPTGTDTAPPTPDCIEPTSGSVEGPFYPGEPQVRTDIREDRAGIVIAIGLTIVRRGTCDPIDSAEVDLWSADAAGDYSGYATFETEEQTWLRGQQRTDVAGRARFTAVVPGAYPGRAVHFHVKVRVPGQPELTTQVYLPDAIVEDVLADPRYAASASITLNADDAFYDDDALLTVTGSPRGGYAADGRIVL